MTEDQSEGRRKPSLMGAGGSISFLRFFLLQRQSDQLIGLISHK